MEGEGEPPAEGEGESVTEGEGEIPAEGEGEGELEGEGECERPLPYFTAQPLQGDAPLSVTFTNYASGYTGWAWEFGDDGQSSDWNPVHVFSTGGSHTVTLNTWNDCGEQSYSQIITVSEAKARAKSCPKAKVK